MYVLLRVKGAPRPPHSSRDDAHAVVWLIDKPSKASSKPSTQSKGTRRMFRPTKICALRDVYWSSMLLFG